MRGPQEEEEEGAERTEEEEASFLPFAAAAAAGSSSTPMPPPMMTMQLSASRLRRFRPLLALRTAVAINVDVSSHAENEERRKARGGDEATPGRYWPASLLFFLRARSFDG